MRAIRVRRLVLAAALALAACAACTALMSDNERYIQGAWQTSGDLGDGQHAYFKVWTFDNGGFALSGYPPLQQQGKYRVSADQGLTLTLHLYDQSGDLGTEEEDLILTLDRQAGTLSEGGYLYQRTTGP